MAKENCWQYPLLVRSRKVVRPLALSTVGAFRVYLNVPSASQFCSATAFSNGVFAPALATTDSASARSES